MLKAAMMVIMAMFFMNNLILLIKFPRRVRTAVLLLFSLPLVLMIRLLKPIVLIRLGSLRTGRLGHLALNTEIYCCEVDAGIHDNSQFLRHVLFILNNYYYFGIVK